MVDRIKVRDGDLRKPVFKTDAKLDRQGLARADGPRNEHTRHRFNSLLAPRQLEKFAPSAPRDHVVHPSRSDPTRRADDHRPELASITAPKPPIEASAIGNVAALGLLVRQRRKSLGFNQQQVADLSGVGRRFISELEAGKSTLEFDRVLQCCKALGIDFFVKARS